MPPSFQCTAPHLRAPVHDGVSAGLTAVVETGVRRDREYEGCPAGLACKVGTRGATLRAFTSTLASAQSRAATRSAGQDEPHLRHVRGLACSPANQKRLLSYFFGLGLITKHTERVAEHKSSVHLVQLFKLR